MSKLTIIVLGLLIQCSFVIGPGMAQEASGENWEELFNGKDLSGWHLLNGQHEVEVKDGVIVGRTLPGLANGFLATEEEYGDFILELEVKADRLLHNSGIQFRSRTDPSRDGRVYGYQAEIDMSPQGWSGSIYDEARRGWLYVWEDRRSPARHAWVNNQWNHYRIEAVGETMRVWVNGIPTAHLVDDETAEGFIALQLHSNSRSADPPGINKVYFRNIRVKTENLQRKPWDELYVVNLIPNQISAQEAYQGFELLFDGKTAENWRGVSDPELPDTGWEIRDGALTILSSGDEELKLPYHQAPPPEPGGGILMTEKEYGPFELKFEFKQPRKGAIAGIEYWVGESQREALYGRLAANKTSFTGQWNQVTVSKEPGEWNHGMIRVLPNHNVEYWLNGRPIMNYERDPDKPSGGHILLDDYGDNISFRSIKIRELE